MKFDNKYIVLKRTDIPKYLTLRDQGQFWRCVNMVNAGRANDGKSQNEYLVVNTDEEWAYQIAEILARNGCIASSDHAIDTINIEFTKLRNELYELENHDPVIARCLALYHYGGASWDHALLLMVITLSKISKENQDRLVYAIQNSPVPIIFPSKGGE